MPLVGDQRDGQNYRDERDADSKLGVGGLCTGQQPLDRPEADEDRRQGDQDHLHKRGQRLGFPVAEAMLVVRGLGGDPHGHQHDKAGDKI